MRLHRGGHVGAGYVVREAGHGTGVRDAPRVVLKDGARPGLVSGQGGWVNFAGPTK